MASFPSFSRSSTGSSSGSKEHSVEIPPTMDLAHGSETSFRGSGDTASLSFEESSSFSSDGDESPTAALTKHHLQGDMHYDDGPTRKSSFQANTSNSAMMLAAISGGANGHHSSPETIDVNTSKLSGSIVNDPKAGMTMTMDAAKHNSTLDSPDQSSVAARIHQYNASSGSGHARGTQSWQPAATGSHYEKSAASEQEEEENNINNSATTPTGPPSHVPLAPVRRIPSLLSSRTTPSRIGSLSSVKEEESEEEDDLNVNNQDQDLEEEITLGALEEGGIDDESYYWDESMSEIGSVHTEDPVLIAIGIVRSPSIQPSDQEASSTPGVEGEVSEAVSETIAQDIAKEEHDTKQREKMAKNTGSARRSSAPSILASRRAAMEMELQNASSSGARRPTRASFSMGSRPPSGKVGPSKSFLLSLPEDELLPTVVEPVAPPVRKSSTSVQSGSEINDDISSKPSPTVTPRGRARKSNSSSGSTMMSDEDRAAKMRAVRGALGVDAGTKRRAYRSHSDASVSQPVMPSRTMSTAAATAEEKYDDFATAEDDDVSACPSLRTIHTMQSSRSLTSTSSGITLDEKTTERIARSSALRAQRPPRTISEDSMLQGSAATPVSAFHAEGDQKMAATSVSSTSLASASASRPSDDKRSMRISSSSMQSTAVAAAAPSSGNLRASDEKAQYRRPDISSMHSRGSTDSQGVASFASGTSSSVAEIHDEAPSHTLMASDSNDEETEDLEAQAGVLVLPGAFAVRNSDDEVIVYDDTDSLVGGGETLVEVLDEDHSQRLTRGSIHGSIEDATPLQAELYEENSFVNAEILIEEEDVEEKTLKRSFLAKTICIFIVVAAIAGIVIGVVIPKTASKDAVIEAGDEEVGVPILEGWSEVGETLMGPTYKDNIRFGNSVALSGDGTRMAVGLPGADDTSPRSLRSTGAVKIYDAINGTEWIEISQIVGLFANAESGLKVALSNDGSRVAIGAPATASDQSGYVAVYQVSNETGTWDQVGNAIRGDLSIEENFGDSIGFSSDGTVLAIGDKYSDRITDGAEDTGLLRVYHEFNNTWIQKGLDVYGEELGERFGWAVALSGDGNRVVATSLGTNDSPGTVQAFDFDGILWNQVGSTLVGESSREAFGASVALSQDGKRLSAGATSFSRGGQEAGVGVVRSYEFGEAKQEWSLLGQPLEGMNPFDAYGSSVDLSSTGDILAIGGPENQNFCDNCGHIQVFQLDDDDKWKRIGSELGKEDIDGGQYGYAVALSSEGNRVAGAAPFTTFDGFVSKVGQVIAFDIDEEEESS